MNLGSVTSAVRGEITVNVLHITSHSTEFHSPIDLLNQLVDRIMDSKKESAIPSKTNSPIREKLFRFKANDSVEVKSSSLPKLISSETSTPPVIQINNSPAAGSY